MSGAIHPTYHRTHGATGDTGYRKATCFQTTNDANMNNAARTTATEDEVNAWFGIFHGSKVGRITVVGL
jgi:hypothetical protein